MVNRDPHIIRAPAKEPIEAVIARIDERTKHMSERLTETVADHEDRIRKQERREWKRAGAYAALAAVLAYLTRGHIELPHI